MTDNTKEKDKKTVQIVDWTAPCDEMARVSCRKVFKNEGGADAFIGKLQEAATLIGIHNEVKISRIEMEVH